MPAIYFCEIQYIYANCYVMVHVNYLGNVELYFKIIFYSKKVYKPGVSNGPYRESKIPVPETVSISGPGISPGIGLLPKQC